MFYINWSIQANLSLCALRKYDCFGLELGTAEGSPSRVHACTTTPCLRLVLSVLWVHGGPSEPPPLDVWSGLMFTVLLTECWRIWADMSPQRSLPAWLCSHIPSVGRYLRGGWAMALLLTGLCLAPSFINTVAGTDTSKRQGFSSGQSNAYQQFTIKKTRKVS